MGEEVGLLKLTWHQAHTLRYLVEQEMIRIRGKIVTAKMAIKTGHISLTKEELKVNLKHYEWDEERLEPLEDAINKFITILQRQHKEEEIKTEGTREHIT